jgi:hypothetical protein
VAFRRSQWVGAGMVAAVAVVAITLARQPSGSAATGLSAAPLGVNVAPWDGLYAGPAAAAVQPMLIAAGIKQLRYGGGSYADLYDWQTNINAGACPQSGESTSASTSTSGCTAQNPLGFAQFSRQAKAIAAESLVTVNYGSGTPAQAAAWVTEAARTAGENVAQWEVGNETYGCWEADDELAGPPEHYQGYQPSVDGDPVNATCPQTAQGAAAGMRTLAASYAVNAERFLKAMKAADPSAVLGVPWAFGPEVPGSAVADSSEWNDTVLRADAPDIGLVDAHYYPFAFSGATGGANPSDSQVLHALLKIPSLQASIEQGLAGRDPSAAVVIGETSVSNGSTTTMCTPVGAVFAAGDVLSWLAAGAQSVDWWSLNDSANTGASCVNPGSGLFTSATPPQPETPYYGYLLASKLAQPGARLKVLTTSDPADVLAYQSWRPDGEHAVAFINLNTSAAAHVTFPAVPGLAGTLNYWSYRAGSQNATRSAVETGTAPALSVATDISLPPESVTVLETQ